MRVHVISDMEGVAGIVKWEQTTGGESLYEEGRKLYTEEINAAVRGAKAAGATEIVVMDCHGAGKGWTFNSLIPEDLDPGVRVRRPGRVDRIHGLPRGGLLRRALRRHARAGGHARRRHEPHDLRAATSRTSGFTEHSSARRGSTLRCAEPGAVPCFS